MITQAIAYRPLPAIPEEGTLQTAGKKTSRRCCRILAPTTCILSPTAVCCKKSMVYFDEINPDLIPHYKLLTDLNKVVTRIDTLKGRIGSEESLTHKLFGRRSISAENLEEILAIIQLEEPVETHKRNRNWTMFACTIVVIGGIFLTTYYSGPARGGSLFLTISAAVGVGLAYLEHQVQSGIYSDVQKILSALIAYRKEFPEGAVNIGELYCNYIRIQKAPSTTYKPTLSLAPAL